METTVINLLKMIIKSAKEKTTDVCVVVVLTVSYSSPLAHLVLVFRVSPVS